MDFLRFSSLLGKLYKVPQELAHRAVGKAAAEEPTWVRSPRGHSDVCHQAIGHREVLQWSSAEDFLSILKQKVAQHTRNQNGWCWREMVSYAILSGFVYLAILLAINNCKDFVCAMKFEETKALFLDLKLLLLSLLFKKVQLILHRDTTKIHKLKSSRSQFELEIRTRNDILMRL